MKIDLRVVSLKSKILEVLNDHSSGCKETELIADLIVRTKDSTMFNNLETYYKAIQSLVDKIEIVVVTYSHPLSDEMFREKRFIYRKYANDS